MKKYDYLVVGSGLFGATFARQITDAGCTCLVIEKRPNVGGNLYCENIDNINVHKFGAHIFHTDNEKVWRYVNSFVTFNRYTNCPIANYKGELYNMPFNMNTFYSLWGVKTPKEAYKKIKEQRSSVNISDPKNLEEKALTLVGKDIYEKLIKGYTEKQWGRKATDLPPFIISRLPLRFTFDNNYFNSKYQGIPEGGYNNLINGLLSGIVVKTGIDYNDNREYWNSLCNKVLYTGTIDSLYDYKLGSLQYRSLYFKQKVLDVENYQGVAVMNFTDFETPYTRIIEHKHFENAISDKTVITYEYPKTWQQGDEPYYPVNDEYNNNLYMQYKALASKNNKLILGGRLGLYKYYDMDKIIEVALTCAEKELENINFSN